MKHWLSVLIGSGVLIIGVDVVTLSLRALGLDKGTAFYVAFVVLITVATVAFGRRVRRLQPDERKEDR